MTVIEYTGGRVELDEEGYLTDFEDWNEDVATALARSEGIGTLTGDMLAVINFMRSYYLQYHSFPILNSVCRNVHRPRECVNEEFIDPVKAWRIAGLPEPGQEVLAYLKRS